MRKVVVLAMAGLCVHEGGAFAPPRVSRRPRHPQPRMLAALPSAALGGTFAGGLHAVTGPDHLAALLPLCVGRRWPRAAATGALWGIGHGLGAALIGALGFALRGGLNLDAVSVYMEVAVGISLMVIGVTGVRESREWAAEVEGCALEEEQGEDIVMTEDSCVSSSEPPLQAVGTTLVNGIINGVSGTGHVLGVMPALAMPSWRVAGAYLSCFGIGTFVAMSLFTGVAGEVSRQMGSRLLDSPCAPANFAMVASVFAIIMGLVWVRRSLVLLGLPVLLARRVAM
eukprot:Transcript_23223.p2 GENE.Transcript_23223~~Transcript_23223.p2  ORF type:complete len:284 (-),score=77.53 Transcript_23223:20-871(-)